ncbi:MAG: cupin domain-containing protein [Planctomycetia bacterium]|nr:cupin domain-containing protein [Planctomycetia bacterium]
MSDRQITVTDIHDLPAQQFDWGSLKWLCSRELAPNSEQTLGLVHILPGQQNPEHYHPNCQEILYMLAGECEHSFDGDWVHLKPGMTICVPAGVRHQLVNKGWEPVTCLVSFSSGDRQTVFV